MDKLADDSQWINGTVLEIPSEKCPVVLDPLTKMNFRILIGDILSMSPSSISNGLFIFASRFISYVDIVGVVRRIDVRENYYLTQVDDGTGQVICTIWRKDVTPEMPDQISYCNQPTESLALGQKLIRLAVRATPVIFSTPDGNGNNLSSSLGVGDTVHLRGRLQLFRESITVSVNYCRIIKDPQEELDSLLQAHHLKTHIYSQPYNPAQIFENLKADLQKSSDGELLQRIQRVIESDGLFHFTALDLQLHAQVINEIRACSELMVDELCYEPDWNIVLPQNDTTNIRSMESGRLKSRVLEIIDKLLKEGIIYRSADPIGGMSSYHVSSSLHALCFSFACFLDLERGVSFNVIMEKLRSFAPTDKSQRPYRSITRSALDKVINCLLGKSQIYTVGPDCYKIA
ncbi:unnamed protein product [Hymenolepis diminuta]|uniref:CST complex subunit STN1 n=1 Tax=Hymenolepis diminuta TaxID=6216 RepID=A0A0R3SAR3_HYMDI|nr:unnamed protein product [Hymenolepis diminuta]